MVRVRNGLGSFHQLREEMDRLFNSLATSSPVQGAARMVVGREAPAVNLWESADELYAELELPGVKSDDLEISVMGSELTVKGKRTEAEGEGLTFHRRERSVGAFSRVVDLPFDVDADRVQASLKDGVLLITLPKAEAAKPRKISVQPGSNA